MKIYFAASTFAGEKSEEVCVKIATFLKKTKHVILSSENSNKAVRNLSLNLKSYNEWSLLANECDLVIIEGSNPSSIEVGFETGMLLARNKIVILLYLEDKDPVFVNNMFSPRLIKSSYTYENVEEVIGWCIEEAKLLTNRRFTFFISPDLDLFLEKVTGKVSISKSEYIRFLIEQEMRKSRHQST